MNSQQTTPNQETHQEKYIRILRTSLQVANETITDIQGNLQKKEEDITSLRSRVGEQNIILRERNDLVQFLHDKLETAGSIISVLESNERNLSIRLENCLLNLQKAQETLSQRSSATQVELCSRAEEDLSSPFAESSPSQWIIHLSSIGVSTFLSLINRFNREIENLQKKLTSIRGNLRQRFIQQLPFGSEGINLKCKEAESLAEELLVALQSSGPSFPELKDHDLLTFQADLLLQLSRLYFRENQGEAVVPTASLYSKNFHRKIFSTLRKSLAEEAPVVYFLIPASLKLIEITVSAAPSEGSYSFCPANTKVDFGSSILPVVKLDLFTYTKTTSMETIKIVIDLSLKLFPATSTAGMKRLREEETSPVQRIESLRVITPPFIVLSHQKQWSRAEDILFYETIENAKIDWQSFGDGLRQHFCTCFRSNLRYSRNLGSLEMESIHRKYFPDGEVTKGKYEVFASWYFGALHLLQYREELIAMWDKRLFQGFIDLDEARKLLSDKPVGTYLIFFDFENKITIAYRKNQQVLSFTLDTNVLSKNYTLANFCLSKKKLRQILVIDQDDNQHLCSRADLEPHKR